MDKEVLAPFEEQEEQFKKEDSEVYKCPNCSGDMVYNPEIQMLHCPYCDNTIELGEKSVEVLERSFDEYLNSPENRSGGETKTLIACQNCGAELIFDESVTAEFCSYCGSSHIVEEENKDYITPDYLIPYKVSEKQGLDLFKSWIGGKFFAPNVVKNGAKSDRLIGNYVPYWTYDAKTYSVYKAQRGDYYYVTRTRTVDGKTETYQERKVRWHWVSGAYDEFHDDYLVCATHKGNEDIIKAVEPFDMRELKAYEKAYISGFIAEKYAVDLKEGWQRARVDIDDDIRYAIRKKIGGDEVRHLSVDTSYSDITFKHIYLPLWLSSFQYNGETYNFIINGQTGEVQGHYPKSPIKIAIAILLSLGLAMIAYYLYSTMNAESVGLLSPLLNA